MAAAAVLSLSFAVVAVAGKRRRPLSMPLAASGAGAAAANEVMATTASSRQRAATAAATVSRGAISPVPSPLVTCRRFSGARSRRRRQAERRAPPLPPTFPLFSAHSPGCCLPPLNAPTRVLSCSERRRPPRRPLRRHFFLCIARRAPLRGGRPRHPISRPSPPPTFSLPLRVWQPPVWPLAAPRRWREVGGGVGGLGEGCSCSRRRGSVLQRGRFPPLPASTRCPPPRGAVTVTAVTVAAVTVTLVTAAAAAAAAPTAAAAAAVGVTVAVWPAACRRGGRNGR